MGAHHRPPAHASLALGHHLGEEGAGRRHRWPQRALAPSASSQPASSQPAPPSQLRACCCPARSLRAPGCLGGQKEGEWPATQATCSPSTEPKRGTAPQTHTTTGAEACAPSESPPRHLSPKGLLASAKPQETRDSLRLEPRTLGTPTPHEFYCEMTLLVQTCFLSLGCKGTRISMN